MKEENQNENFFIKKRDFDLDKALKEFDLLIKIEDYYLFKNKEGEILLGGIKLINLHKLSPVLFTYQLKYWKYLTDKEFEHFKENFEKKDILYSVGIITLNSMRKFKYIETLNILSIIFKKKENAWFMLDFLERFEDV